MTLVSKGAIFHFHDYGRKGNNFHQFPISPAMQVTKSHLARQVRELEVFAGVVGGEPG